LNHGKQLINHLLHAVARACVPILVLRYCNATPMLTRIIGMQ